MTTTQDDLIAELQRTTADLRRERDTARAERDARLVRHGSEYNERIEHQAATIDMLKAMSASPGDPQPVFDLIAERARDICGGYGVTVTEFDGALIVHRASTGVSEDPAIRAAARAAYPMPAALDRPIGRAILNREIFHSRDHDAEPGLLRVPHYDTVKSSVVVPMVRGDMATGALAMGSRERGGFSDTQVELLKTFAEQAVIAIGSAEAYRALNTRTAELTERDAENRALIARQQASIQVLRAISTSPDDTQPVFELIVRHARELCDAQTAGVIEYDGTLMRTRVVPGLDPVAAELLRRSFPRPPGQETVAGRAVLSGQIVHVRDTATEVNYFQTGHALGTRSMLGVPLQREGRVIGAIILGRFNPGGFDDNQIARVESFADQAVIALTSATTLGELRRGFS